MTIELSLDQALVDIHCAEDAYVKAKDAYVKAKDAYFKAEGDFIMAQARYFHAKDTYKRAYRIAVTPVKPGEGEMTK